jgi:hypothetical protein
MSPKTRALVVLYGTILVLAVPGLAVVFGTAGHTQIAAVLTIAGASIGVIYHAYQTAISQLKDGDGNTGSGATKLGGKSVPPPGPAVSPFRTMPIDVPAFARPTFRFFRGLIVNKIADSVAALTIMIVIVTIVVGDIGCSWFKANGPTVVTDVAQITNCVIAAVDAGNPDGGSVNLTEVASACGASTVDAVIQILDQTLTSEQASATLNVARIVKLKALGADASRAKLVRDGGAQ